MNDKPLKEIQEKNLAKMKKKLNFFKMLKLSKKKKMNLIEIKMNCHQKIKIIKL